MLSIIDITYTIVLIFFLLLLLNFLLLFLNKKNQKQLDKIFLINISLSFFWVLNAFLSILFKDILSESLFLHLGDIAFCFLPTTLLLLAIIFKNDVFSFKPKYILLFIFPILSLVIMYTNDFHHLYSSNISPVFSEINLGAFGYFNYAYTILECLASIYILIKYIIKNAGFFSKAALFLIIGLSIPTLHYLLGFLNIVPISLYQTPIFFAFAISFITISAEKFNISKNPPISLQQLVDRMSDAYVVINENYIISDFNKAFLEIFGKKDYEIRNKSYIDLVSDLNSPDFSVEEFKEDIETVKRTNRTISKEIHSIQLDKYFHIECTPIFIGNDFLGTLLLYKDYTQHVKDMQTLQNSNALLMEEERLASLGQLIGGIAHNLKTPIMSISGAAEGINDLIKEFDSSIGDPEVKKEDYHDIAKDMYSWVDKIKNYAEYMSDVITAVKGQAVVLSEQDSYTFTIVELIKRVDILMRHELKNALVTLDVTVFIDENTKITGNVNSLVQVINNMISNSIQAYNGKTDQHIELNISKKGSNIIIAIKDYAGGLPKEVSDKLFKEMITTKGKNGTGLGLFMSYSNIRAHFNGNITVDSKPGVGTEFNIILPV